MEAIWIALLILCVLLAFHRWFWTLAFGLGTIAALFAMLASIVHFQILGALGFFILTCILGSIAGAIMGKAS